MIAGVLKGMMRRVLSRIEGSWGKRKKGARYVSWKRERTYIIAQYVRSREFISV